MTLLPGREAPAEMAPMARQMESSNPFVFSFRLSVILDNHSNEPCLRFESVVSNGQHLAYRMMIGS
jgi:hypothetical protein